jgi:hypothetical protein
MAFTEAQKLKICRIFAPDLQIDVLDDRLEYYAQYITAEVESQVGALILEYYPASGSNPSRNVTNIKAMEANFGAEINSGTLRSIIKKEIATLLYLTDYLQSGGSRVVRIP